MPKDIPQISFGGGEISPAVYSRVDLSKFSTAVKTLKNFFVNAEGGASNRAGFTYMKEVKDSTKTTRLIAFEFNEEQAYVVEFGDYYIRFYSDGGAVLESSKTITGITQANPAVVTSNSHGYANGQEVYIVGVVGMTEVNGNFYKVAGVTTNTFQLTTLSGTNVNSSAYTAYSSAGTAAVVHTITSPYPHTALAKLKFRQSNDVLYLAHTSYAPRKLVRTGAANWTLSTISFKPDQAHPTGISVTVNTSGSVTDIYKVTAVAEETAEESLVGLNTTTKTITGATAADPVVITASSHGFSNGDEVHISGITGMTEINDRRFTIANVATNTFELSGEDGSAHTAYSSGGSANQTFVKVTNSASSRDNTIAWTAVTGAESYNVYRDDNGLVGFIGATENTSFTDDNIEPDLNDTAPKWRQPFETATNWPGAVGLHEQRSVWGNTTTDPLTLWMSQISQFQNMNVSSPTRDADSVTARLVTGRGNEIRHFRSFQDRLFIFTSGAIWSLRPGGDVDAITPASKKASIEEYLSTTDVPPLTIKSNLLLVSGQANLGFEVHSLGYKFDTDAYAGSDLTVLARHLFEGKTINEWCYAERPFRLVASVRSDGKLIVMTYLQEHQVFAWSVWEAASGGTFESVCAVPEGQEDKIYVVVNRSIGGSSVKYIEHLHSRAFSSIEDAFFVDSGLTYSAPVAISGITSAKPAVVTATAHGFSDGDEVKIRDVSGMTDVNGDQFIVVESTSNTFEILDTDYSYSISAATKANPGVITTNAPHGYSTGDEVGFLNVGGMTQLNGNGYTITVISTTTFSIGVDTSSYGTYTSGGRVYKNTDASAFSTYTSGGNVYKEVSTISGLDHLEGQSVIALADGNLVTNLTVSSGSVSLPNPASIVHVGLSYTGQIDSLPLNLSVATLSRTKAVKQVTVRVKDTRGLYIGPDVTSLEEYPSRSTELWGDPASTLTDLIRLPISDDWAREAGITIVSEQGLPMTILSMMADTDVGD